MGVAGTRQKLLDSVCGQYIIFVDADDWEYILKGSYLKKMIARCGIDFDFRQLIINNVKNRQLVESHAQKKVDEGIIDAYYFAEDTEAVVLDFFDTPKESFGNEFTSLFREPSYFQRQVDFFKSIYKTYFHKYENMSHKEVL